MNPFLNFCLGGGDSRSPETRQRCGTRAALVGILLNVLLSLGKGLAGLLTSSVAMVADAANNLSDAASSVVTLIGFRMAAQEADADHPFGHGRAEYVSGLVVALAILLMGFEVGKSAVDALFHPQPVDATPLSLIILGVAILVKVWMFWFNRSVGKAIDSSAMEATAADCLSDAASTGVVLLSSIASKWTDLPIDGLAGLAVAFLILKAGWESAKDTLDPLLGRPMSPELAFEIDQTLKKYDCILGIHDLVYHDYGPGRAMMSFHAEVPADSDFLEIHDIIDTIEREMKAQFLIDTVIHMDPVVCDEATLALRDQVAALAAAIDPVLSIHDFRTTAGPHHTNLIFDVVIPFSFYLSDDEVCAQLTQSIKGLSDRYYTVIHVDHSYLEQQKG